MSETVNSVREEVWEVNDMTRLKRFLCTGTETGTMYLTEKDLGLESAQCIQRLLQDGHGQDVITEIVKFSEEGRAAKQNTVIFALAFCAKLSTDLATKQAAFKVLSQVCRIPTHVFTFIDYAKKFCESGKTKGWGRAQRKAICSWYNTKEPQQLALHVTKYIQRAGWSHIDLLRLAHVKPANNAIGVVFKYLTKGLAVAKTEFGKEDATDDVKSLLQYLEAVDTVKHPTDAHQVARLVEQHQLAREHISTALLKSKEVWTALLQHMPLQALLRNLGKMTTMGILNPLSPQAKTVIDRLADNEFIKNSRIHPMNILLALKSYTSGKGEKSKGKWRPNNNITDALNQAFMASFKNVSPTNLRYLIAVDVSQSMQFVGVNGSPQLSPVTCAGAIAMTIARSEKQYELYAFSEGLVEVKLNGELPLQNISVGVLGQSKKVRTGPTDCSLPILHALEKKRPVDVFIVFTDSECVSPNMKPAEALRQYRIEMKIPYARLIVISLTCNSFTIADPEDPGMLDIAGFDSAVPQVINQFVTGKL